MLHLALSLALSLDQHRAPGASSLGLGLEGGLGTTEGLYHLHTVQNASGGGDYRVRERHRQECRAEADGPREIAANLSLCYPRQPRGVRRRSCSMQESVDAHMVSIRHFVKSRGQSKLEAWVVARPGRSSDASAAQNGGWAEPSAACPVLHYVPTLYAMCNQTLREVGGA